MFSRLCSRALAPVLRRAEPSPFRSVSIAAAYSPISSGKCSLIVSKNCSVLEPSRCYSSTPQDTDTDTESFGPNGTGAFGESTDSSSSSSSSNSAAATSNDDNDGGPVRVYVGNLDFSIEAYELQQIFERIGPVSDTHMPKDRQTDRPRGFAFITYSSRNDALKAIQTMDQTELYGRTITVNESRPRERVPFGQPRQMDMGPFNSAGNAEVRLFVGNLGVRADQESIEELFCAYGTVIDCYLPTDRNTGNSRGFGFVTMPADEAELACQKMNGVEFGGRLLQVNEAQPKPPLKGGGGGGGFRGNDYGGGGFNNSFGGNTRYTGGGGGGYRGGGDGGGYGGGGGRSDDGW